MTEARLRGSWAADDEDGGRGGGMKIETWTSGHDIISVTFDGKGAANNRVIHTESTALKLDAQGF